MADEPRISNSRDYDETAGTRCPHCGNDDPKLIDKIWVGFLCEVCSKIWRGVPGKYR